MRSDMMVVIKQGVAVAVGVHGPPIYFFVTRISNMGLRHCESERGGKDVLQDSVYSIQRASHKVLRVFP